MNSVFPANKTQKRIQIPNVGATLHPHRKQIARKLPAQIPNVAATITDATISAARKLRKASVALNAEAVTCSVDPDFSILLSTDKSRPWDRRRAASTASIAVHTT